MTHSNDWIVFIVINFLAVNNAARLSYFKWVWDSLLREILSRRTKQHHGWFEQLIIGASVNAGWENPINSYGKFETNITVLKRVQMIHGFKNGWKKKGYRENF